MSIYTDEGHEIPHLRLTVDMLLNRSIVVYGASKSGKTVMIKHCLDLLRGHAKQGFVVSPTEPANKSYSNYFPKPLIHYVLKARNPKKPAEWLEGDKGAEQWLKEMWQRQMMMVQTYEAANRIEVLRTIASRLSKEDRTAIDRKLRPIHEKFKMAVASIRKKYRNNPGESKEKCAEAEEMVQEVERKLYKTFFLNHYAYLWSNGGLSDEERTSLMYIHFDPHTVLILDDCGADLKPLMNRAIFKNLFYRNRHAKLTVIHAYQDCTDLTPALRKNAFVSIFCDRASAQSFIDQKSNQFSKDVKKRVGSYLDSVFVGYRKLARIRDTIPSKEFCHTMAAPSQGKMFPCRAVLDVCDAIKRGAGMADTSNPYYTAFAAHA